MSIPAITFDDYERKIFLPSGKVLINAHTSTECLREFCPAHFPSAHNKKHLLLDYDFLRSVFVRILEHPISYDGKAPFRKVPDPDDYLLNSKPLVIMRNALTCLDCWDTIKSTSRHDFQSCSCGNSSVDGGFSYIRHSGNNIKNQSLIFNRRGYIPEDDSPLIRRGGGTHGK